jgi:Domain of unknown function (DUF1942)
MAAAAAVAAIAVTTSSAVAPADPTIVRFGTAQTLDDRWYVNDGTDLNHIIISYTVSNLGPSNDAVNVPLQGRLWEATVAVDVLQGHGFVLPAIVLFIARSADGDSYRALYQATAPDSLVPVLPPSGHTTGKIYFDVTGPSPSEVVFDDILDGPFVWN